MLSCLSKSSSRIWPAFAKVCIQKSWTKWYWVPLLLKNVKPIQEWKPLGILCVRFARWWWERERHRQVLTCQPSGSRWNGPDLETQTRRPTWPPQKAHFPQFVPTSNQNTISNPLFASFAFKSVGIRGKNTLLFTFLSFRTSFSFMIIHRYSCVEGNHILVSHICALPYCSVSLGGGGGGGCSWVLNKSMLTCSYRPQAERRTSSSGSKFRRMMVLADWPGAKEEDKLPSLITVRVEIGSESPSRVK